MIYTARSAKYRQYLNRVEDRSFAPHTFIAYVRGDDSFWVGGGKAEQRDIGTIRLSTGVWPGKGVVCLPTRVGAESVYWRIKEEASSEYGCLAALRTGTVHHGSNNAFLMVMTHGYSCKELL